MGTVVGARGEQDDPGLLDAPGETAEVLEQLGGVALDGAHRGRFEKFRDGLGEHGPGLEAIGHARDVADIILDDHPASAGIAGQVERRHMHERVVGYGQAHRVALIAGIVVDEFERHHAVLEGFLGIVDVAEELVPDSHPLENAPGEEPPGLRIEDPGEQVVRQDPVGRIVFVVECEGDPEVAHEALSAIGQTLEFTGIVAGKLIAESTVDLRTDALGQQGLVKGLDGGRRWAVGGHRFGSGCGPQATSINRAGPTLFRGSSRHDRTDPSD